MATYYIGLDKGNTHAQMLGGVYAGAAEGSSTTGKTVEVTFPDDGSISKTELLRLLNEIGQFVLEDPNGTLPFGV